MFWCAFVYSVTSGAISLVLVEPLKWHPLVSRGDLQITCVILVKGAMEASPKPKKCKNCVNSGKGLVQKLVRNKDPS